MSEFKIVLQTEHGGCLRGHQRSNNLVSWLSWSSSKVCGQFILLVGADS